MLTDTAAVSGAPTQLYLDGGFTTASNDAVFEVEDPATGQLLAEVSDATADDGYRALDSADGAQAAWAATTPRERSEILTRTWQLILDNRDQLADLMTLEMGKPLAESHGEVAYGSEFFRWFAEEAVRINGRYTQSPSGAGRILVSKEPVGPTLAITPWNFPLAMGARKIAPALAAGCTMIIKPAAETPLTMLFLADLLHRAGVPAGVVSVLPTSDPARLTEPLLRDQRIRKLTFTGSTGVGKLLIRQSADRVLRTSMELGGNAPFVVFADADLDAAVEGAVAAKMRNTGEACTAANRIHVDNSVRAQFTAQLTARLASMRMGPGQQPGVAVGPLISEKQRATVSALVDDAIAKGAQVTTGGRTPDGPGWFYPPTVLDDVPPSARILSEEVFGPVAAISGFDGEVEGITAANATEYGLVSRVVSS